MVNLALGSSLVTWQLGVGWDAGLSVSLSLTKSPSLQIIIIIIGAFIFGLWPLTRGSGTWHGMAWHIK